MEEKITKEALKRELIFGQQPALELLYNNYSGMLYGYILQFVTDRKQAEELLVKIFHTLPARLEQACQSNLSVYCWLQVEARKIILEQPQEQGVMLAAPVTSIQKRIDYYSLLQDASAEHRWVFRELFLLGKQKEDLAGQVGKDLAYISMLLKESLLIIRKKLQ